MRACSFQHWDRAMVAADTRRCAQVVLFNHVSWVDGLVMMRMFAPSGLVTARPTMPMSDWPCYGNKAHIDLSVKTYAL